MGNQPGHGGSSRLVAGLALAGVSFIAAVVSYLHALAVVRMAGSTAPVVYLIPFLADLVILGASAVRLNATETGRRKPPLATVSLAVGIGVTLAMNVAAGWRNGPGAALIAGWPALAFVLSLSSLELLRRPAKVPPAAAVMSRCPHGPPASAADALRITYEHSRDCLGEPVSQRQLAATLGANRARVAELVKPGMNGHTAEVSDEH